jgi:hypothetical protein
VEGQLEIVSAISSSQPVVVQEEGWCCSWVKSNIIMYFGYQSLFGICPFYFAHTMKSSIYFALTMKIIYFMSGL